MDNQISSEVLPGVDPAPAAVVPAGCGCLECHSKLDALLLAVQTLITKETQVDADIQKMIDQAAADENAEAAAATLLQTLFSKLATAVAGSGPISAADRVTIQKTVAAMQTSSTAMAAAIVANTPASAVSVLPAAMTISSGSAGQVTVKDSTGKDITSTAEYSIADPTIASVSSSGLVTGIKAGTTTLSVADPNGENETDVPVQVV
jgi:hypothetical protein